MPRVRYFRMVYERAVSDVVIVVLVPRYPEFSFAYYVAMSRKIS
jgi:hypothetical protein